MKSKYRSLLACILMIGATIQMSFAQSVDTAEASVSPKVQLGASINPFLVVVAGGSFETAPEFSLQAKIIGEKLNKRVALEYRPPTNNFPWVSSRFLAQTDSTVTTLSEDFRQQSVRLALGAERKLNEGRIQAYIGADAFVSVNFLEFSAWTNTSMGDSNITEFPNVGVSTTDIVMGAGGRLFFGVQGNISDRFSISTEVAPTLAYTSTYNYTADDNLNITKSRSDLLDFTNLPLVNVRVHYSFF